MFLQKTISTGAVQIENDDLMERYLYIGSHEAIISDEMFMAVQQEKISRSKESQNQAIMKLTFWCHEMIRFPAESFYPNGFNENRF